MSEDRKDTPTIDAVSSPDTQPITGAQEQFTAAVDELLDQLQHKFETVSREMFGKLDDMTRRLDELEASLTVTADTATTASSPTK
ncbi:hypothetical protein FE257_001416 [Aspergillus nanangensis]|uniref:Heat shock factor binding protein 1-domain-containing protein n=1 Tax=Aspergillus nanangensis TaxID=2582783 RepID=A0AAD4GNV7_ASPNN|nr:hypothetical protein FE257_001416 [Aspergillus nanangensis]